jgi:NADH-quinone oxidoreductase subunit M
VHAPILSLILWSPLAFGALLLLMPSEPVGVVRRTAFVFSLVPFLLSLVMLAQFERGIGTLQLVESVAWMPSLGVRYSLGVDGFSLWLVLLTTLLTPVVLLASWTDIEHRVKEFMFFMLVLEWGMLGALLALDLFLFFLFWELMLFPMAFLIGIWGGGRRYYATIKFVLYTMAGSALMLVAVLYLVFTHARTGPLTFDIESLYGTRLGGFEQTLLFWAFAIAFMIKVPMVPVHTWLADAHTEAPTGGSVQLAGVLLKMGGYGFLRFALPMFPLAAQNAFPVIVAIAVVGIVYGAMVAFPQPDMKRLVAYSSVSHMGFVMLGIFAFNQVGLSGGVLQMLNHGVSTSGLFLLIGLMHHRTHTREISEYGGIWASVPIWASIFLVVMLGSIGLPGTNGFVGEFLILMGAFRAHRWAAALGTTGVVLGAAYLLTMYKHVVFGPLRNPKHAKLADLSGREVVAMVPILALTLVIGIYPRFFLERIEPTVNQLLSRLERGGATRYIVPPEEPARLAARVLEGASR